MNTDAKARKTKPLRSAFKARKLPQNGKPRDDVGCLCLIPHSLLTSFAAARKKFTEAEPEPEPESQAQTQTAQDDDEMYV
jgi:hypothetical protein